MGASKGGGYIKQDLLSPEGISLLQQILGGSAKDLSAGQNLADNPLYQQSVEGTRQFLPGGQGFEPIQKQALQNFQQQTIPSILNSLGSGNKGSSALNQALANAGQNLNTSLGSQLAQMQLQASGQGANLAQLPYQQGLQSAQVGLGTTPYAFQQRPNSFLQDALLAGISGTSQIGKAYVGRPG